jgi:hypothetical protein
LVWLLIKFKFFEIAERFISALARLIIWQAYFDLGRLAI